MNISEIKHVDQRHLWHPYAAPGARNYLVRSTDGVYLTLDNGEKVIDAMSSWWSAIHGHGHPSLKEAAHQQIDTMSHVMFGGLTHEPATKLTASLMELTGGSLPQVFYSDSGSVAVEVAIKMAFQAAKGQGHPERTKLLTWRSGYHGDTFATMSVCDPDNGMHSMWTGILHSHVFAPAPPVRGASPEAIESYLAHLETLIDASIAGFILEPVVQGAGGMRFHDPAVVKGVAALCKKHGIFLIADEIATGFGRTGELFATLSNGITPDIMCVGKALTGGFMSFAATLCTDEVASLISSPAGGGALMHGPTFMANPLACAVATASLTLIAEGSWKTQVPRLEQELRAGLAPIAELEGVADIRVLGAIGVIEMDNNVRMEQAIEAALAHGVWVRPFGRLIYVMPPYVTTTEECARICTALHAAVLASTQGE